MPRATEPSQTMTKCTAHSVKGSVLTKFYVGKRKGFETPIVTFRIKSGSPENTPEPASSI